MPEFLNPASALNNHTEQTWDQTLAINLTATQRLLTATIPYLKLGVNPSILVVGSRNFAAPGPGAAAYSVSKAGITQLARVAALELAADGVRVNVMHPDAVFDTALWTDDALGQLGRALRHECRGVQGKKSAAAGNPLGGCRATAIGDGQRCIHCDNRCTDTH